MATVLPTKLWCDDFETKNITFTADGQTSINGEWYCRYKINGTATDTDGTFVIKPEVVANPDTRAVLVTTTDNFTNFIADFWMRTDSQNKTSGPNDWETAWFMWHFTDNWHHYYMLIHSNGEVEIGRKDYATQIEQQIFLYTSATGKVSNVVGTGTSNWHNVVLTVTGTAGSQRIICTIDGVQICDITDNGTIGSDSNKGGGRPDPPTAAMNSGKMGLYCEDSQARYDNIVIKLLP